MAMPIGSEGEYFFPHVGSASTKAPEYGVMAQLGIGIATIVFSFIVCFLIPLLFIMLMNWLWVNLSPFAAKLLTTAAMIIIAVGLFWIRSKHLLIYGIFEILFGLVSCWKHLGTGKAPEWGKIDMIVLVGVIYLLVRGFGNISDAVSDGEDSRDAAFKQLASQVRYLMQSSRSLPSETAAHPSEPTSAT